MGCNSSTEAIPKEKNQVLDGAANRKKVSAGEVMPGAWVPLPMATEPVPFGTSAMNATRTSQFSIRRDRASVNATITTMVQARRLDLWSNDSDLASRDGHGLMFAAHGDGASPDFSAVAVDPTKPLPQISGDELLQFVEAETSSEKQVECGDLGVTMPLAMSELANDLGAAEARAEAAPLNLPPAFCLTMYTLAAHDLRNTAVPTFASNGAIRQWRTEVANSGGVL